MKRFTIKSKIKSKSRALIVTSQKNDGNGAKTEKSSPIFAQIEPKKIAPICIINNRFKLKINNAFILVLTDVNELIVRNEIFIVLKF